MAKTCTNPVEIYARGVSELDERSKSKMPLEDITKRTLRNQRSKNNPNIFFYFVILLNK